MLRDESDAGFEPKAAARRASADVFSQIAKV
jgi:hypothetical protein